MVSPIKAVRVENLTKQFNGFTAVDHIFFDVDEGEIFGFLGPNGAGKTTTVKMLCTLLRPSAGSAQVAGFDIERQHGLVRKSIGIIFQDPSLDDRLTARENLRFHGIIYKVPRRALPGKIDQALSLIELEDRADDLVRNFSSGMKRRLEIARGLMHSPKVLFLDEPTIGLDPQTRHRIWKYLCSLRREYGITLFLTTHYMDEAEYCDRIAIIDHGTIIALGTPQALKAGVRDDVISIQTSDDIRAKQEILEKCGIAAKEDPSGLEFAVPNGAEFVPRLIHGLSVQVKSIHVSRPTLDDVFLKLTGKKIRESDVTRKDRLKTTMRRIGRRWR
jgi:ABC-2 type transport system ATP-binding protein